MKNSRLDNWLRVSSALAFLIGVVLVLVQLGQNAELLELQILKQDADNYTETEISLLPENIYEIRQKSLDEPENLTPYEFQVLEILYWSMGIARWRSLYDLAERGLLDQSVWKRMVREDAAWTLGNPFGRAFWERTKDEVPHLPTQFIELVDASLADTRGNESDYAYADIMKRIKAKK